MIIESALEIINGLKNLEKENLSDLGMDALSLIKKSAENILSSSESKYITAKSMDGKESRVVSPFEPYLINTDGRNVVIHINKDDRLVLTKISLRDIEAKWSSYFSRISRTSLISNSAIKTVRRKKAGYEVELTGELGKIEISRRSFYSIRKNL